MGSSMDRGVRLSRPSTLALLIFGVGLAIFAALAAHAGSASASGATPTISTVNGGAAVSATGAKVIIPITGTNFANPKVTITGTSGNVKVLGLAAGTSSTRLNVIVHLPTSNDAAGTKVVTVKNHQAGTATSSLTVDAAPVISSLNTNNFFKGGTENLTISGTGFRSGATLLPLKDVEWSNVTRVNSTTITATAKVAAVPSGGKRVVQVSIPSDGGFSSAVGSSANRLTFVDLPRVGNYFYFGQNSASTSVSIKGLPTTVGNLDSVSFGSNAAASFSTSDWNAAKTTSIPGTLSFGAGATLGDRSMTLVFSSGLTITNPRAVFITPAPTVSGYDDGAPRSFPYAVSDSGSPQQITVVGAHFAATSHSGLTPIASVTGTAAGVSIGATYGAGQTTGYVDPHHLYISLTASTCTGGTDSLTITNPTQAGTAKVPGIVGGSLTIANAITVSCVPEIDSISPDVVPNDGQFHSITISGRNFASGATVSNSNSWADYQSTTVVDDTTITTSIRGSEPVDVLMYVTNPSGEKNVDGAAFTFQSVPSFTSFSPMVVPLDSSPHTVTVTGAQFLPGAVLSVDSGSVGDATLGSTTYVDYHHLTVSVTGTTAGAIDLTVDNTDGGTATQVDAIGIGVAPSITAASLSTTPTVGSSVDADVTVSGTPTPDLAYQWYRCNSSVTGSLSDAAVPAGCSAITGAADASYTPVAADRIKYVTVMVTASNGDKPDAVALASSSSLTLYAPYFTNAFIPSPPSGERIGSTLVAGYAVFSRPSATVSYQWYDCANQLTGPDLSTGTPPSDCTAISGATSATYLIQASDAGSYVTVAETATNGISPDAGAVANSTDYIEGPVGIRSLTVSGDATPGQTLTSSLSTYGGPPVNDTSYQWYDCPDAVTADLGAGAPPAGCSAILLATSSSYVVTSSDVGQAIVLYVSVKNDLDGTSGYSDSTAIVTGPPGITSLPLASTALVGDTLAPVATATGYPVPTVTYSWYLCTSLPTNTLTAGSDGGASYLSGSACSLVQGPSSSSSFDTSTYSAGDFLVLAATATYGLASSTAIAGLTLEGS